MADGTELGSLYYDIDLDDKKVRDGISRIDKDVQASGGNLSKLGDTVQAGFRDVARGLAVAGVGLTAYAKSATDFTKQYVADSKNLGRQLGVSTEEASRLVSALGRMGIEAGSASQIFGIFAKNIQASTQANKDSQLQSEKLRLDIEKTKREIVATTAEIRNHGDKSGELNLKLRELNNTLQQQQADLTKSGDAFARLGVATVDASGKQRSFNDILFDVADKFKGMPDGIEKTALSMELFGRSGKDMIKVLNLGSDGIADLEKEADRLGLTLNANTIARVSALVQSQKQLKQQTDALKVSVGTATAPILTKFNEKLVEMTQSLLDAGGPTKALTTNVLAFGGPVASAGAGVAGFLGNISSLTPKIAQLGLRLGAVGIILTAIGLAVYLVVDHFGGLAQTVAAVHHAFDGLAVPLAAVGTFFNTLIKPALDAIALTIQYQLWPALQNLYASLYQIYVALSPALIDALKVTAVVIGSVLLVAVFAIVAAFWVLANVLTVIVAGVSGVINIIGMFITVLGQLGAAVANRVIEIGTWFGRLPGYVWNAINTAINYFRNFPGGIRAAIGNLDDLLVDAGAGLIRGFITGIKNKFGDVKTTLQDLTKKLTSWKGPEAVDRVLLVDTGKMIINGFVNGLQSQFPAVRSALGGLTDSLSGAVLTPQLSMAGAGAGMTNNSSTQSYGDTNINIGTIQNREDADYIIGVIDSNQRDRRRGVAPR